MKTALFLSLLLAGCATGPGRDVMSTKATQVAPATGYIGAVCVVEQAPEGAKTLGYVSVTKRTYGSTDEALEALKKAARYMGANAVVVQVSQRFHGPVPWRAVAPAGRATALYVPNFVCKGE